MVDSNGARLGGDVTFSMACPCDDEDFLIVSVMVPDASGLVLLDNSA